MIIIDMLFFTLVALSLLGMTVWRSALWGLSAWGIVSVPLGVILAGCAAAIYLWRTAARQYPAPPRTRTGKSWPVVIAFIASLAVLWLLRIRYDLWGERHALATALDYGMLNRPGAPLGTAIHWVLYRFMNVTFLWDGTASSMYLSILAGAGFVAAAVHAAGLLDAEGGWSARGLGTALLVTNGFLLVFFGAGGNAPIASLFTLLFLVAALRFLRGGIRLIFPAVLFFAAVFSHLPAVYLAPGFIYLFLHACRAKEKRQQVFPAAAALVACWAGMELVFALEGTGRGPTTYLISLLPGIGRAAGNLFYTDAAKHLLTAANGFLILGPASAAALVLLLSRRTGGPGRSRDVQPPQKEGQPRNEKQPQRGDQQRDEERLLAICAAGAVLVFPLAARRLDGGLRWDVLASAGPAFALYTLHAIRRRARDERAFRRGAVILTSLGVFHIIPLIVCGMHGPTAERRLLSLPLDPGRGTFILAERSYERMEYRAAFDWYTATIERNDAYHTAHARLGDIHMMRENYIDAITSYLAAVEEAPGNRSYRIRLAEAYIEKNWYEEAIDNLESLTAEYPDSVRFWRRLGYARNHSRRYEEAMAAYERALELEPGRDENARNLTSAVLNRAAELQKEGDKEAAKVLYDRAIQLYPADWRASNNLAVMAMDEGNTQEALRVLRTALEAHPFVSPLNLNMGLVLEELGENEKALRYLRKSAELDPLHSGAGPHIERLIKKLEEQE